jgi:hypothetical protein
MERLRGPVEDHLIDDLVEWSMWHYATSEFIGMVDFITDVFC